MEKSSDDGGLSPLLLIAVQEDRRRDRLARLLGQGAFHVEQVADGRRCLEAFHALRPELILVEGGPAGLDGVEICRALRLLPGGEDALVVLVHDSLDVELVRRARAAGVDEFVPESAPIELIEHRLRRVLQHGRLLVFAGDAAHALEMGKAPAPHASRPAPVGQEAFLARVAAALPRAQGEAKHVAILAVNLTPEPTAHEAPGVDLEQLWAAAGSALEAALELFDGALALHQRGEVVLTQVEAGRFAVLIPELDRVQDASKLGSRIHEQLTPSLVVGGRHVPVDVHVGIAIYPADAQEVSLLLERAQTACEYARQEGRAQLWYYTESMNRWVFERLTLEASLRDALAGDELRVYYQPRVDVETRRVVGTEALVRWIHPRLGLISPAQFIPLAEESGLIVPIGEWVLREACRQAREWRDRGLPAIRMSVNLSAVQFRSPDLFDLVTGVLAECGLPHAALELELTESMLMKDPKSAIGTLGRLKSSGISLSIDDFGTGYSSLSYLKRFPIDTLKIDQSFVSEITTHPEDAAIATTIILMGHSLHLEVVAEGVETESQLSFLQVLQCNQAQGFLFSPPLPADQATAYLESFAPAAV